MHSPVLVHLIFHHDCAYYLCTTFFLPRWLLGAMKIEAIVSGDDQYQNSRPVCPAVVKCIRESAHTFVTWAMANIGKNAKWPYIYIQLYSLNTKPIKNTMAGLNAQTSSSMLRRRFIRTTAELPFRCTLGHRWNVVINRSNFKSETIFGLFNPTTRSMLLDFFVKPQNGLVWPF